MPLDMRQAAVAIARAALRDSNSSPSKPPRRRKPIISTPKAMLLGAGLMVAGQRLAKNRGRAAFESVQNLLSEGADNDEELVEDDEEFLDDEPLEEDDEPIDEEDEEPIDEEDEEPVDEEDEEPVDEEDEEPAPSRRRAGVARRRR